ncbi:MAG: hypothetical protein H7Y04_10830, partial [Verrucomicrobia bacterium]|nr:hypothetical protein [Cytophagales bacterium]
MQIFTENEQLLPGLHEYVAEITSKLRDAGLIPSYRRLILHDIATYVINNFLENQFSNLLFVCTHNSRRSQLCQVWGQIAAFHYDLPLVKCFSGGLETENVSEKILQTLEHAGFHVDNPETQNVYNPQHKVYYSTEFDYISLFSKPYNDAGNPKNNFCTVMNCTPSGEKYQQIDGSKLNVSLIYQNPKDNDDKPDETQVYKQISYKVSLEMFY